MFADEPISPELALVDPELAERLRRRMLAEDARREADALIGSTVRPAAAITFLSPPPVAVHAPTASPPSTAPVAEPLPGANPAALESPAVDPRGVPEPPTVVAGADRGRTATRRPRGVRVANGVATALVVLIAVVPLLAFLPPRQAPSIGTQADAATNAPQPRTLAWPAQLHADYYVVQVLRRGQVVWTSFPQEPTADLPTALSAGTYTWRVKSGFGPIDLNEHRGPIATGTFVVEAP